MLPGSITTSRKHGARETGERPEGVSTRAIWRAKLIVTGLFLLASVPAIAFFIVSVLKNRVDALGSLTVVIGDWIPTSLEILFVLSMAGVGALTVAGSLAPPPDRRWPVLVRVLITLVLLITVPFSLLAVAFLGGRDFRILPARSDGGCRVVVQEDWLGGTIGILQPGSATVGWAGEFYTDDGYNPFQNGTYALTWDGKNGQITMSGTSADPAGFYGIPPALRCRT